jgi:hypothetical protein
MRQDLGLHVQATHFNLGAGRLLDGSNPAFCDPAQLGPAFSNRILATAMPKKLEAGGKPLRDADIRRLDYLLDPPPLATRGSVLITNPPFSKEAPGREKPLDKFLERTIALLDSGHHLAAAVLLVRIDFAGTQGRAEALNRAVAEWEYTQRTRWIPGTTGNPRLWCMWVAWLAGRSGPPVHTRLRLLT